MKKERVVILWWMFLCLLCSTNCFNFWDASLNNVTLPNHFIIDTESDLLIVAAKNSICHLSMDLTRQFNVRVAAPHPNDKYHCINEEFELPENCENYPHVLTLPFGHETIQHRNGTMIPVSDTVLFCGSNALSPECEYRDRNNLEVLQTRSGVGFSPYKHHPGVISMWISSGQLMSATPTNTQGEVFQISMSNNPFNGEVAVTTIQSNQNWFYNSLKFVSMHEIGDFVYIFFQEEALESPEKVVYSRVARICKNDTGSLDVADISEIKIFTTFIKARISCTSGTETSTDIPFHYNEIQDTFLITDGSPDATTGSEQLFAVFNTPRNGPVGSAVCKFTFDSQSENNVATVFNGGYLRQEEHQWVSVANYDPFTCAPGSRSLQDARNIQLMQDTVTSSNGPRPLLVSEEYHFDKIVVSHITALDNQTYDVMFIAAHISEKLVMIKASLSQDQEYQIIRTEELGRATRISQMKLSKQGSEGHIYLATDDGIYGLSVANCSAYYTDCCSCVAARDPFCAYDVSFGVCAAVSNASSGSIQDLVGGNTALCPNTCEEKVTTENVRPTTPPTTTGCVENTSDSTDSKQSTDTTSAPPNTPIVGALPSSAVKNYTWTIVGSVVGLVVGVFCGMLVAALFFRRSNIMRSKRGRTRRRRRDIEDSSHHVHGNERKSFIAKSDHQSSGVAISSSKAKPKPEEYIKNNNVQRLNDYTSMSHSSQPTTGRAAKFAASYPAPHNAAHNDSHRRQVAPIPVPPPISPFKKTGKAFSFDGGIPSSPPHYSTLSMQRKSDPNVKSNTRTDEAITDQQRAAYGPNILSRQPSLDTSKHASYSRATLPIMSPRFSTQEFVKVSDCETGCSQC